MPKAEPLRNTERLQPSSNADPEGEHRHGANSSPDPAGIVGVSPPLFTVNGRRYVYDQARTVRLVRRHWN